MSCPAIVNFFSLACDAGALMVMRGADFLSVFGRPQRKAVQSPSLRPIKTLPPRFRGGPWLFPFSILVLPVVFLPRFLGVWLIMKGCSSLIISSTRLLIPKCQQKVFTLFLPALLEELAIIPCS